MTAVEVGAVRWATAATAVLEEWILTSSQEGPAPTSSREPSTVAASRRSQFGEIELVPVGPPG